jgi:hypothetical protein
MLGARLLRARLSSLASQEPTSIVSGAMYSWRVRAVQDALEKAGKAEGPLNVDDLCSLGHLDQYHYLGTEACDEVAVLFGLGTGSTILDIGSGIGGPARCMLLESRTWF